MTRPRARRALLPRRQRDGLRGPEPEGIVDGMDLGEEPLQQRCTSPRYFSFEIPPVHHLVHLHGLHRSRECVPPLDGERGGVHAEEPRDLGAPLAQLVRPHHEEPLRRHRVEYRLVVGGPVVEVAR